MNVRNFTTRLSKGEASTMLVTSGWLGIQLRYPQARLLANQLASIAFPFSKEFLSAALHVYNCEAMTIH